jgi:predicted DCC family thiol-disulfide oxidoreductase YuxK
MNMPDHVILFDGICNLCNWSVDFVIKRDRKNQFRFMSLQDVRIPLLFPFLNDLHGYDSVVFIEDKVVLRESEAVLRICSLLGFPWNLMSVSRILPLKIRNIFYRWVAENRFRWFGKRTVCRVPGPGDSARFL